MVIWLVWDDFIECLPCMGSFKTYMEPVFSKPSAGVPSPPPSLAGLVDARVTHPLDLEVRRCDRTFGVWSQ